jgi:Replication-relaxation
MHGLHRWMEKDAMLTNADRLIAILHTLRAATSEQIATITGWNEGYVKKLLIDVKNTGQRNKKEAERSKNEQEKWLVTYEIKEPKRMTFYLLGEKGTARACDIHRVPFKSWKIAPSPQVAHFFGINEILCRLRRAGYQETDWMNAQEVERDLYFDWERVRNQTGEKLRRLANQEKVPVRPDGFIEINDKTFFLEYDTGHERGRGLTRRFYNYLKLWNEIDPGELPSQKVVWIVRKESRIATVERHAKIACAMFKKDRGIKRYSEKPFRFPALHIFVEGEETLFLLGEKSNIAVDWQKPVE